MIYNIIDIENTKQNICLRNKMVKDYLEKIRQEYIEHKVSLEEQISSYENKVKENTKFLQVLEKETNPGYEAFRPREFYSFHKEKVVILCIKVGHFTGNNVMCICNYSAFHSLTKNLFQLDYGQGLRFNQFMQHIAGADGGKLIGIADHYQTAAERQSIQKA